jgi:CheY-like chemotaxis protein
MEIAVPVPQHLRSNELEQPGEAVVQDQRTPIRPVRVPDDVVVDDASETSIASASSTVPSVSWKGITASPSSTSADYMRVLVAEDDPVNSKIIKKRLEKLGHEVMLTVNGEECASAYCDRSGFFDIILMDMQVRTTVSTS